MKQKGECTFCPTHFVPNAKCFRQHSIWKSIQRVGNILFVVYAEHHLKGDEMRLLPTVASVAAAL